MRRAGRLYGPDALEVAATVAALGRLRRPGRHLRAVRAAVDRETALIEDVVAPILRQRGAGAREQAGQTARELAALAVRLHRALIEGALARPVPGAAGRGAPPPGPAAGRAAGCRASRCAEPARPAAACRGIHGCAGHADTGCTLTKGVAYEQGPEVRQRVRRV